MKGEVWLVLSKHQGAPNPFAMFCPRRVFPPRFFPPPWWQEEKKSKLRDSAVYGESILTKSTGEQRERPLVVSFGLGRKAVSFYSLVLSGFSERETHLSWEKEEPS